jgi:hypothetical protein
MSVMSVIDLSALLCDTDALTAVCIAGVFATLIASVAATFVALSQAASECRDASERAALAERSLVTQAVCHARDSESLVQAVRDIHSDIDVINREMFATRQLMKGKAAEIEALLDENEALARDMDDIAGEVGAIEAVVREAVAEVDRETNDILIELNACRSETNERRGALLQAKFDCERQIAHATMRAESAVDSAAKELDRLARDTQHPPLEAGGAAVKDERLCFAVAEDRRREKLQRANAAICDEVERVWSQHVRRLQARVRANGAALASLNSESEMVSQQEQLVGACVELHREAAAVKEDADETEAALVASPPRLQVLRSISTNATPSTAKRNPVHVHVDISSCRTVLDDASPRRSGPCPGSYLDLEPLDLLAAGGMSPL